MAAKYTTDIDKDFLRFKYFADFFLRVNKT
jgi:hypothetical protein